MPATLKMDLPYSLHSWGNGLIGMCVSQALPNPAKLTRNGDHLDYHHSFCCFPFLFPLLSLLSSPLLAPRALELGLYPLSSHLSETVLLSPLISGNSLPTSHHSIRQLPCSPCVLLSWFHQAAGTHGLLDIPGPEPRHRASS